MGDACNICHRSAEEHQNGLFCCPFCGCARCYINEPEEGYNNGFHGQCAECLTRQMTWATENDARYDWNCRASGWIACAERMPEAPRNILAAILGVMVIACFFDGENFIAAQNPNEPDDWDWVIDPATVTHWMPLPSPPAATDNAS